MSDAIDKLQADQDVVAPTPKLRSGRLLPRDADAPSPGDLLQISIHGFYGQPVWVTSIQWDSGNKHDVYLNLPSALAGVHRLLGEIDE